VAVSSLLAVDVAVTDDDSATIAQLRATTLGDRRGLRADEQNRL
jgi:hypothetical protein